MSTVPASPILGNAQQNEFFNFNQNGDSAISNIVTNFLGLEQLVSAQPTNEAASILVNIEKIPGTIAIGSIETALEAYGYYIGGRKKSVVGETGQLMSSGHVVLWDLCIVFPDNPFVESAIQQAFSGSNVGTVKLTYLRNTGDTGQPAFDIEISDARITSLYEGAHNTIVSFGFDTIKMNYYTIDEEATASGQVSAGFNLSTNAPAS